MPFTVVRDAIPPTATITVPARSGSPAIPVEWSGDDGADSGVATSVQYRVDDGDWTAWLTSTTQTQADFVGEYCHTYTFRVRATDNVGNVGDWAEAPTVVVQVTKYYTFGGGELPCARVVWYTTCTLTTSVLPPWSRITQHASRPGSGTTPTARPVDARAPYQPISASPGSGRRTSACWTTTPGSTIRCSAGSCSRIR
ncbi:MAG: hypothetical protein NUW24_17025 [Anaerolineae bacterium]|nr:hypothetical protein [Anaerolineae bacterium]